MRHCWTVAKMAAPFYISTSGVWVSQVFVLAIRGLWHATFSSSVHFSNSCSCSASFHNFTSHSYVLVMHMVIKTFYFSDCIIIYGNKWLKISRESQMMFWEYLFKIEINICDIMKSVSTYSRSYYCGYSSETMKLNC